MEFSTEGSKTDFQKSNELTIEMVISLYLKDSKEKTSKEIREELISDQNFLKHIVTPSIEEIENFLSRMTDIEILYKDGNSYKLDDDIHESNDFDKYYKNLLKKLEQNDSESEQEETIKKGRGRRYPDKQTDILQEYYYNHNSPPNEKDLANLAEKTKLTTKQIVKWFDNQKRKKKSKRRKEVVKKSESEEVETCKNCNKEVSEGEKLCNECKNPEPPKKKLKKVRKYADDITNILEEQFKLDEDPNDEEVEVLAKKVNLSSKQVKKWFSNQKRKRLSPKDTKEKPKPKPKEEIKVQEKVEEPKEDIDTKRARILKGYYQENKKPSLELIQEISEKTELSILKVTEWFKNQKEEAEKDVEVARGKMFPKEITDILKHYFHTESTHPSSEEVEKLSEETSLNFIQVSKWFNNQRRKYRLKKEELPNPKKKCKLCEATLADTSSNYCTDCSSKTIDVSNILEEKYKENPNPSFEEILELSRRINLNSRDIKKWFKERKPVIQEEMQVKEEFIEDNSEKDTRNMKDYEDIIYGVTEKPLKEIEIDFGMKQIHYQIYYGNLDKYSQSIHCFECKRALISGEPFQFCEFENCTNFFHASCFDKESLVYCNHHFCIACKEYARFKCQSCSFSLCENHLEDTEMKRLILELQAPFFCRNCKYHFNKL